VEKSINKIAVFTMKRLLLLILIVVLISIFGSFPNLVFGDDEASMLTPEETEFLTNLVRECTNVVYECQKFEEIINWNYLNAQDIENWYLGFPKILTSTEIQNAPAVFENIRMQWNNELCPAYAALHKNLYSCFDNAMEHPDWTITRSQFKECLRKYEPAAKDIQERAWALYDTARDIEFKLVETRKEVREQAKPLIEEAKGLLNEGAGDNKDNDSDTESDKEGEGCFIATAAYGTPRATEINELRCFRDEYLRKSNFGNAFIRFYYATSPPVADFISQHYVLRFAVREGFVAPIVVLVELTENWWTE
jgi:hypothetical protein